MPEGRLWVMGDHRANSADSRSHQDTDYGGTVSEDEVVGRAMVIAWPLGHWNTLDEPTTYASVSDSAPGSIAGAPSSHRVATDDPGQREEIVQLPTPAELPLVMGVVGLRRAWRGRRQRVRSRRGDVAVGARSGQGGEEHRGRSAGPGDPDAGHAAFSGSDERAVEDGGVNEDGTRTGGQGPDGPEQDRPKKQQRSFWKELPILIGIALVLALLIKTFLVQAFSIPSDSMQNTLQRGDRVLVDKLTPWFGSEPERGEVVVFHDPDNWLAGEPTPTRTRCRRPSASSA